MSLTRKQVAMTNYPYFKYSLDYTLDSLERLGAEAIELYAVDPHFHIDDCDIPQAMAIRRKLRDHGLQPICITPEQVKYPINIAAESAICRKRSLDVYTKVIQFANVLESPTVQFFAGWCPIDEREMKYDEYWKRSAEAFSYLGDLAAGYGVTIVIESADKNLTVLDGTDKAGKMIREVNNPAVQGMIDSLWLVVNNETVEQAIDNLGKEHFRHFHFTDAKTDQIEFNHMIPGDGGMDLSHILDVLNEINYRGYLSMELLEPYEKEPEKAMQKAVNWMYQHITA